MMLLVEQSRGWGEEISRMCAATDGNCPVCEKTELCLRNASILGDPAEDSQSRSERGQPYPVLYRWQGTNRAARAGDRGWALETRKCHGVRSETSFN